jgi:hypothetical protein
MKNSKITLVLILAIAVSLAITGRGFAQAPGLTLDQYSLSKTGEPGHTVSYQVSLTNTSAEAVAVDISISPSAKWVTTTSPTGPISLAAGANAQVEIRVQIPADAANGTNDIADVTFSDGSSTPVTLRVETVASIPQQPSGRPLVLVNGYDTGGKVRGGQEFTLKLQFANKGTLSAVNITITFDNAGFKARSTGGTVFIPVLDAGKETTISQNFTVGSDLTWAGVGSLTGTYSYEDGFGKPYTGSFSCTITIDYPSSSGTSATATPNIPKRPQLVVSTYTTDVDPLQPGTIFNLNLDIRNLGQADASNVTMVLGGGVTPSSDNGTPGPGGVLGSGGELTNFAPIGSSNVVFIGGLAKDALVSVPVKLIVNVSTTPGAYTLKISFVYFDSKGNQLVDDQVITLLVYALPQVEISYYRDPGTFNAGMMSMLPLQVTNLGKKSYVLGNMKVTAENADITNNVALVGALDPGGYFTQDVNFMPLSEGPVEVKVSINYTDDFNMPRFVEQTLQIDVGPAIDMGTAPSDGSITPGKGDGSAGDGASAAPETFIQKVWRIIKGLLGLDSGLSSGSGSNEASTETPTPAPIIIGPKG